ncbi:MAG: dihydropteroate synthase [Deltaproteobacteria bacterium]|nr:MAG: dihydropteroate synthase [Deltaproteobacteria bacterium]
MRREFVLDCRGKTLRLGRRTAVMGILNVTPDSFSDGGLFLDPERAVDHALRMVEEGADIIDVGGESTRPGADPIPLQEELRRVLPVIEGLSQRTDVPISIDTYKAEVASRALEAGASIINDISGLHYDPRMGEVAAKYGAPVVVMHIKGTPKTMQASPRYDDLMGEITAYLREGIRRAEEAGLPPEKVIVDPGIGFGKTVEHNLIILQRLDELSSLGRPILIGPSRKSFIGAVLDLQVGDRLYGTLASVAIGVERGAHIVRVHDVKPVREVVDMVDAIMEAGS